MDYRLINNLTELQKNATGMIYEFTSNGRALTAKLGGKRLPLHSTLNLLKKTRHWTVGQLMEEAKEKLKDPTHFYLVLRTVKG